ncbi:MAG: hydrogenase expression/formation protein [Hyphomicrobiales bacterium]|nr:MAG: hydrogenase expression/formation protein [Hyphomicrobiales bacterium]
MTRPIRSGCADGVRTGLAAAILGEIAGHLGRLAEDPSYSDAIDLRSLPMTDADREDLRAALGQGEVGAVVDVGGETRVDESAFAGVWWVEHRGADGRVMAEQIVVARVPDILLAHPADIADAHRRLIATDFQDQAASQAAATPSDPAAKEETHG